jgi:hypothetical protein
MRAVNILARDGQLTWRITMEGVLSDYPYSYSLRVPQSDTRLLLAGQRQGLGVTLERKVDGLRVSVA